MRHRRGAHQGLSFRMARQHDPDDPRMPFDEPLEQGHAVHTGHSHVGHDDVDALTLEKLERRHGAPDEVHVPLVAHRPEHPLQAMKDVGLIVDKQDPLHSWNRPLQSHSARSRA